MRKQAICEGPTPVLNTPYFKTIFGGHSGSDLLRDEKGHMRALEFVALKNTRFEIEMAIPRHDHYIFKVRCPQYPSSSLYVDSRFVKLVSRADTHTVSLPNTTEVLEILNSLLGKPYIWGGNWSMGIQRLLLLYPPKGAINDQTKKQWTLEGVDCSGLLYEATEGHTPRNTSQLLNYGNPVLPNSSSIKSILECLQPLDLIVFPGHMFIVYDKDTSIESQENLGVIKMNLKKRLQELLTSRHCIEKSSSQKNTENYFVIRRWISN